MSDYEIEKDVVIPARTLEGGSKYPFSSMDVGDSFSFNIADESRVSNACSSYKKKSGSSFIIRKITPSLKRCWRTK